MEELSKRERDVLELLGRGLSNRQIAEALFIGQETVKTHLKSVFRKTGATSRYELMVRLHREGATADPESLDPVDPPPDADPPDASPPDDAA